MSTWKMVLRYAGAGLVIEIVGFFFLAIGWENLARIISLYPGMVVFLFIPAAARNRMPEAALFYLGFLSGAIVWALASSLVYALVRGGFRRHAR